MLNNILGNLFNNLNYKKNGTKENFYSFSVMDEIISPRFESNHLICNGLNPQKQLQWIICNGLKSKAVISAVPMGLISQPRASGSSDL